MPLNRVNTVTIFLIVQLTPSFVSSEPVSMYVRQEANSQNFVYVNFYKDTFQSMYNCMADMNAEQCNAKGVNQNSEIPYHPEVNYKVINVNQTTASSVARGYFTCQFSQFATALECTRNTTDQFGKNMCTSFSLRSSSRCECVYVMWKYKGEKLLYNKTDIKDCKTECTETTSVYMSEDSTEPSSPSNVACTLLPKHSTDATTNSSNIANSGSNSSPKSVPIIIGVVVGLLVIASIIIVAIIYRRKKLTTTSNNDISSSRTDAKYNRSPSKPGMTKRNIPDVLSTLPFSHGSETRGDSEDGYYTIDKDCGLKRYENGLNAVSSKTSGTIEGRQFNFRDMNRYANELRFSPQGFQAHEGDNSDLPPTREGDYFTIEAVNNESEDTATESDEKNNIGEYSLAKDVTTIDVIDVSSPPKNIYSRFGHNEPDVKNPYDILLQKYEILNSRKNSLDDTPLQGTAEDKDTHRVDTSIGKLSVESGGSSPAFKTLPDMTRDVDKARGQFPEYSVVSKVDK